MFIPLMVFAILIKKVIIKASQSFFLLALAVADRRRLTRDDEERVFVW